MERVLVTGGAGFIGRNLVKSLARKGRKVVIADIAETGETDTVTAYRKDIRNAEAMQTIVRKERIDTCIHLAARVSVSDSISNPDETLDTNVKGTMSVLEACARNGIQNFVFASSAAVYGEPKTLPLREDEILNPLSPYGRSKIAGEQLVGTYKAYGKIESAVSLRFFNVYGENQNPAYAGVITKFIERLSKGLPPVIYGDGNQTRDFISVIDVVNAIELAAESGLSDTFNVASGKATSINELAQKMIEIFGLDLKPTYVESVEGDIVHSYADVTKAKNMLHFSAEQNLDSELKKMLISPTLIKKPKST